jgi:hypothetical protein
MELNDTNLLELGIEIVAAMKANCYSVSIEDGRIMALEETRESDYEGLPDAKTYATRERERLEKQALFVAKIALEKIESLSVPPQYNRRKILMVGAASHFHHVSTCEREPIIIHRADRIETVDEKNATIFSNHLFSKGMIINFDVLNQPKKDIFEKLDIRTYEKFKAQYVLIQSKTSLLPSSLRKEIETAWIDLFES